MDLQPTLPITTQATTTDMASAANAIRDFNGEKNEDVYAWEKEFTTITTMFDLTETQLKRVLVCKLKKTAQTWFINFLASNSNAGSNTILRNLKLQFSGTNTTHEKMDSFLKLQVAKSKEEYESLFKIADELYQREAMSESNLIRFTIQRCPIVVRSLLAQYTANDGEWIAFMGAAREFSWMCFNSNDVDDKKESPCDKEIFRIYEKKNYQKNRKNAKYGKKNCLLHGRCSHSTEECTLMKDLKSRNIRVSTNSRVNEICEDDENEVNLINRNERYTLLNKNKKNPFTIEITPVNGLKHKALIDTGADVSIMEHRNLNKNIKIQQANTATTLKSACGGIIPIKGKANVQITYNDKFFNVEPYITSFPLNKTILGKDFILKNQEILQNILKSCFKESKDNYEKEKENIKIHIVQDISLEKIRKEFFTKFKELFPENINSQTLCNVDTHKINTTSTEPIKQYNFRIPIHLEKLISEEIEKLKENKIIQITKSDWNSRIIPILKPDNTLRLCIDFRPLNKITIKDNYPLPIIEDIIDRLGTANIFSILDAKSGYYQVAIDDRDIPKTAFTWKNNKYEFLRMPFGLCNAPLTFQRIMDKIVEDEENVMVYLDDIILKSNSLEEHKELLERIILKLKAAGISLNKNKCKIFCTEIKILGHIIRDNKVFPDSSKLKTIEKFNLPTDIKELRSFLGLCNYNRDFIKDYAGLTSPLYDLLKGFSKRSTAKIIWSQINEDRFYKIRDQLGKEVFKHLPDLNKTFILTTDASEKSIGGILSQKSENGTEYVISYFSKKLKDAQLNYSVTDKELLAAIKAIENYRHYLLGKEFVLRTDHKAIQYLWETKNPTSRLMRWSLFLQEFKFKIEYIKGESNAADYLSRYLYEVKLDDDDLCEEDINKILNEYHIISGHGSSNTMKFLIRRKYKWPGMWKQIEEYVNKCEICIREGGRILQTKHKIIHAERPNKMWQIDLIGRIPVGDKNYFIVVAIDHYTKWMETRIINKKSAEIVTNAVKELIIDKHGIPEMIYSDNGAEFANQNIRNLCDRYKLKWIFNSPGHHNAVGLVERANETLMSKIRKLSNFGMKDWKQIVKNATHAYNISFHRAIDTSPMLIKYGLIPDFPVDVIKKKAGWKVSLDVLRKKRDVKFGEYAKNNIQKGKKEDKRKFDVKNKVLIFKESIGGKLSSKWVKGFEIEKRVNDDSYIVTDGKTKYRVHKSFLKRDETI